VPSQFQERLYHRGTGTLREFFAGDWSLHREHGEIVEPGHQFEWVWLLHQYRQRGGALDVAKEADTLFRFALRYGFDPEYGGIHDQVSPDGAPLLRTRRIWPVTEAIKACVAMTEVGRDYRADANRLAAQLLHDFVPQSRIGWHETLTREGAPSMTELPGSTPYHLFLGAAEAERLLPSQ
jgi:mannose-6-phosphate isomerase